MVIKPATNLRLTRNKWPSVVKAGVTTLRTSYAKRFVLPCRRACEGLERLQLLINQGINETLNFATALNDTSVADHLRLSVDPAAQDAESCDFDCFLGHFNVFCLVVFSIEAIIRIAMLGRVSPTT